MLLLAATHRFRFRQYYYHLELHEFHFVRTHWKSSDGVGLRSRRRLSCGKRLLWSVLWIHTPSTHLDARGLFSRAPWTSSNSCRCFLNGLLLQRHCNGVLPSMNSNNTPFTVMVYSRNQSPLANLLIERFLHIKEISLLCRSIRISNM